MARVRVNQRGSTSTLNPGAGKPMVKRREGEEMPETEIVGFLSRKIQQAMGDSDGDISDEREENYNYYVGKLYGNEREGYSKYVTREALEAVEWVLPAVLRVFVSGDEVVVFEPSTAEDEEQAAQETDIVNHAILKSNNGQGFLALFSWFKDALMNPNAYIKAVMEETNKMEVGTFTGLNAFGLNTITSNPEYEILAQRERTYIEENGQPNTVYDVKTRCHKTYNQLVLLPVPPEECLVDNNLTTLCLDEADFLAHRCRKSFTQLVKSGIDEDELMEIGSSENYQFDDERVNRLFYDDENPAAEDEDDPSMRKYWVHECYCWIDVDGDNIAEYRRILLIGDKVFENEEVNYQPLVALGSILVPHRHVALSLIDIVKDLQLLSSTLIRGLLDSIYRTNLNRKYFNEDALTEDGTTMEAMLNAQAEFIPVRGLPGNAVMPEQHQSIVGEILPVMQNLNDVKKMRTGVSPETSIDPNILQEVRQDVYTGALEQASQRVEMLIRVFAETGVRQLMIKVHQLMRSNWDIKKTQKIRGKWVNVDPTEWMEREDLTVNVGLGFNSKNHTLALLSQLLTMQKEAMQVGLTDPKRIYHILSKWMKTAGLGEGSQAFVDPMSPDYKPPQPPPDPNMILANAQAQALQVEGQNKTRKTIMDGQIAQQKVRGEAAKAQREMQDATLDREVRLRELAIKQFEVENKVRYSEAELQAKIDDIRESARLKASQSMKVETEALAMMIETGKTYQQAKQIVEQGVDNEGEDDGTGEIDAEVEVE